MHARDELQAALRDLTQYAVKRFPFELPRHRFDGEEVTTAEEVAAIAGIPLTEARLRLALDQKDVYSGTAAHSTTVGVGTVIEGRRMYQRARRIAGVLIRRRKKRKRKRETQ